MIENQQNANKPIPLKTIYDKYFTVSNTVINAMPKSGYKNGEQLKKQGPIQLYNIKQQMQIGIFILETAIQQLSIEKPLDQIIAMIIFQFNQQQTIKTNEDNIQKGCELLRKNILFPYAYNIRIESGKETPIYHTLTGIWINMNFYYYAIGNCQYPLVVNDTLENKTHTDLMKSREQYQFLLKRKFLSLKLPKNVININTEGPMVTLKFTDFEFSFESRPNTFWKNQQIDLLLLFQRVKLSDSLKSHEERINQIMRQKIDFLLSPETEKYFIKYLEQLFLRVRYAYFYLERIYNHIQANKNNFCDVKYLPNSMSLKFYFSKNYSYMNEIMGENGLYQISFSVHNLSFTQFIKFKVKADTDQKLKQRHEKQQNEDKIIQNKRNGKMDIEFIEKNNGENKNNIEDFDIIQINVFGSRFNNLSEHTVEFPENYQMSDNIDYLMKYIENCVYSYSQSKTAFANYNMKLFSKSYKSLLVNHPNIILMQQGQADFVLIPSLQLNIVPFSKQNIIFFDYDENKLKKKHQEYENEQFDNNHEENQKTHLENDKNLNKYLRFIAQIGVCKDKNTLRIHDFYGKQIYDIIPFQRHQLTKIYFNQICIKMLENMIFTILQKYEYKHVKSVDYEYYFASRHQYYNPQIKETSIFKMNIDYSNPAQIAFLFVLDQQREYFTQREELQFDDLIARFSYSDSPSDKATEQNPQSKCTTNTFENVCQYFNYEDMNNLFENFISYAKQQVSNETHIYKEALCQTFKCSQQELQIQIQLRDSTIKT